MRTIPAVTILWVFGLGLLPSSLCDLGQASFPHGTVSPLSHQGFDLMLSELPVCDAKPEHKELTV